MTYTPYYRTGGTARFQWHKAAACPTKEAAQKVCAEVNRMGYLCLYAETSALEAIGLPETWDVNDKLPEVAHE